MKLRTCGIGSIDLAAREYFCALEFCNGHRFVRPVLALSMSWIDSLASLDPPREHAKNEQVFCSWLQRYADCHHDLGVTETDLWGLRCGILHALSPSSDASRRGKARQFAFAWGRAKAAPRANELKHTGLEAKFVILHVDELLNFVHKATQNFFDWLCECPHLRSEVIKKAAESHFEEYPETWNIRSWEPLGNDGSQAP